MSRSAALYSSSVMAPFLWRASSVVSVRAKSVRSWRFFGTVGGALAAGADLLSPDDCGSDVCACASTGTRSRTARHRSALSITGHSFRAGEGTVLVRGDWRCYCLLGYARLALPLA